MTIWKCKKKGLKIQFVWLMITLIVLDNELNVAFAFAHYGVFTNCSKCTLLPFFGHFHVFYLFYSYFTNSPLHWNKSL